MRYFIVRCVITHAGTGISTRPSVCFNSMKKEEILKKFLKPRHCMLFNFFRVLRRYHYGGDIRDNIDILLSWWPSVGIIATGNTIPRLK
jgi:hypothetical protein